MAQQNDNFIKQMVVQDVSEKPTMEKYGWYNRNGFDDTQGGWMFEGGEEAYYEALKKWEEANGTCH
jgi:hypothetical protein